MSAEHFVDFSLTEGPEPIPSNHILDEFERAGVITIYDAENKDAWIASDKNALGVSIR